MDRVKRFIKNNPAIPFMVLFVVMAVFFAGVTLRYGDDEVYAHQVLESGPVQLALTFRQTWSARLVIELVQFTLYTLPPFVWKIANSLLIVLLAHSFSRLCGTLGDRRMNWLACAMLCVYPMGEMISAGWIATTCNYLWPLALGVYALCPWVERLAGRRVPPHSYPLALLALVYAANADVMLAILVGFTLAFFAWMLYKKQKPGVFAFVWVAVLLGMLALYLTAPGTSVRLAQEQELYSTSFTELHPARRLYNVFMTASWYLLFHRGHAFLLLAFCLCVAAFAATKSVRQRAVAALPLGVGLAFGPLLPVLGGLFPGFGNLAGFSASMPLQFKSSVSAVVPFLVFAATWVLLFFAAARWAPRPVRLPVLLVLAAGLCSVLVMCMVPSAGISFQRYTLYIQMAMLFAAYLLLARLHGENRLAATPQLATAVMAGGGLASLFLSW